MTEGKSVINTVPHQGGARPKDRSRVRSLALVLLAALCVSGDAAGQAAAVPLSQRLAEIAASARLRVGAHQCGAAASEASKALRPVVAEIRAVAKADDRAWLVPWAALLTQVEAAWVDEPTCAVGEGLVLPVLDAATTELGREPGPTESHPRSRHQGLANALRGIESACHLDSPQGTTVVLPVTDRALVLWLPGSQAPDDGVTVSEVGEGGKSRDLLRAPDARRASVLRLKSDRGGRTSRRVELVVGTRAPLSKVAMECAW